MAEKKITVTKTMAATCQLETSIKLFLENRDLVSAYTLCCAADGILEGIYRNEREEILKNQREQPTRSDNLRFSWAEEVERLVKPEHWKTVRQSLYFPQNFFKHADRDHDSSFEFPDWELTGVRLVVTIISYEVVLGESTPAMKVFLALYAALNPNLLTDGNPLQEAVAAVPEFKTLSRQEIAASGYAVLRSTCPRLFEQPRFIGSDWTQP